MFAPIEKHINFILFSVSGVGSSRQKHICKENFNQKIVNYLGKTIHSTVEGHYITEEIYMHFR